MKTIHLLMYLYVKALLALLPFCIALLRHVIAAIQTELDYLQSGFTFMVSVRGEKLCCVCRITPKGSVRPVCPRKASNGEVKIDYHIEFRSLACAFRAFCGSMSLAEALAERAFTTRGPNNCGVSLTYMFTAILKLFFGFRSCYRSSEKPTRHTYITIPATAVVTGVTDTEAANAAASTLAAQGGLA